MGDYHMLEQRVSIHCADPCMPMLTVAYSESFCVALVTPLGKRSNLTAAESYYWCILRAFKYFARLLALQQLNNLLLGFFFCFKSCGLKPRWNKILQGVIWSWH